MRLWSLHPKYLDRIGLIALWREGLLAKKVLENKTKGYRNHPQLIRFKKYENPLIAINAYLFQVYKEGLNRGYNFKPEKIETIEAEKIIPVTTGQVDFEFRHLLKKLRERSKSKYFEIMKAKKIEVNPVFKLVKGELEYWEKT